MERKMKVKFLIVACVIIIAFSLISFACSGESGSNGGSGGDTQLATIPLAGEWFLGASDLQGTHTWDGSLIIDNTGAVTGGTLNSSEGLSYTFTVGNLSINTTGRVTGSMTDSDGVTTEFTMQMDNGGNIMAGEGNATGNEDGMFFLTRNMQ
jgi:hypothetical protein